MLTTFMAWVSGAIAISPPPTPAMAVTSGSSVASSEPKAMNNTTAAASTPTAELTPSEDCSVRLMASPPSWTSSPGARAASAAFTTRVISAVAMSLDCLVKLTTAYAMRPSWLIWAAPRGPYGLTTPATSGIVATVRSIELIRTVTDRSRTVPWLTRQTIVSESPA